MGTIKSVAYVNSVIDEVRLFLINPLRFFKSAPFVQPVQHLIDEVNTKYGRRIIRRIVIKERLVLKHNRQILPCRFQVRMLGNTDNRSGRAHILLNTRIDEIKVLHIYGTGKKIAGHIANQGQIKVRKRLPLRTVNRIIRCQIYVIRIRQQVELFRFGNSSKTFAFTGGYVIYVAVKSGSLFSLFRPHSRVDITAAML